MVKKTDGVCLDKISATKKVKNNKTMGYLLWALFY